MKFYISWTNPWLFIMAAGFLVTFLLNITYIIYKSKQLKKKPKVWKPITLIIIFTFWALAFLGPLYGKREKTVAIEGKDIFLIVDVSPSMEATDIQPSRLKKIKYEIKNILNNLRNDRVGLIIFSGESFLQCPLTSDYNLLYSVFIQSLSTEIIQTEGSHLAGALEIAYEKFKKIPKLPNKAKIALVFSDGEIFDSQVEPSLSKLHSEATHIWFIGVGSREGSKIYTPQGPRKDKEGIPIISKLNSLNLKSYSQFTLGNYYEISLINNNSKNEMEKLLNDLENIKGVLREDPKNKTNDNIFYLFLIGMALMCLIVFIN